MLASADLCSFSTMRTFSKSLSFHPSLYIHPFLYIHLLPASTLQVLRRLVLYFTLNLLPSPAMFGVIRYYFYREWLTVYGYYFVYCWSLFYLRFITLGFWPYMHLSSLSIQSIFDYMQLRQLFEGKQTNFPSWTWSENHRFNRVTLRRTSWVTIGFILAQAISWLCRLSLFKSKNHDHSRNISQLNPPTASDLLAALVKPRWLRWKIVNEYL